MHELTNESAVDWEKTRGVLDEATGSGLRWQTGVPTVLSAYEVHAGRKVARDASVEHTDALMNLTTGLITRNE